MKIKRYQKSVPIQSKLNEYSSNKALINSARKQENEYFKFLTFDNYPLPFQGWKIHIAPRIKDYSKVIKIIYTYCLNNFLEFKYLKNYELAKMYSSKSLHLQMYGKLITIYPKNEEDFKLHIENLYQLLKKYKGLNVIVDKQYKNSIIFYRYGTNYSQRPYFVNPITLKKEPDRSKNYFYLPSFVKDVFEEQPIISTKLSQYNLPYNIYQNTSGFIFLGAKQNDNKLITIKQTHIYTYFDSKISLVSLRKREEKFWKIINPPIFIESFFENNYFYVVKEFINGRDLDNVLNSNLIYSLLDHKNYSDFLFNIILNLVKVIDFHHKNNIILKDINLGNFIITNKNEFHFIDYDFSFFIDEDFKKKFDLKNNVILDTDIFQIDKSDNLTHFQKDYFKLAIMFLQHFFNHFYFKKHNSLFSLDLLLFWKFTKFFGLKSYIFKSINLLLYQNPEKVNFAQELVKIKEKHYKKEAFLMFSENYIINKVEDILAKNPKIKFKFKSWKHKLIFSVINNINIENIENKNSHYKNPNKLSVSNLIFYCFYLLNNFIKNKNSENQKNLKETIDILISKVSKDNEHYVIKIKNVISPYLQNGILALIFLLFKVKDIFTEYQTLFNKLLKQAFKTFTLKTNLWFGISGYIMFFINYYKETASKKAYKQILSLIEILLLSYNESENDIFDTIKINNNYFEWNINGKLYVLKSFYSIIKQNKEKNKGN